jgi:hypothetical protein
MLDQPRSLKNDEERRRRHAMLSSCQIAPLTRYVQQLREEWTYVPDFDPLDGGISAGALFLFEKPGPKTVPPTGSGFISRNNDDATAEATFNFMVQADLPRQLVILWNVIPGWNGTTKIGPGELEKGLDSLPRLLTLLENIKVVVLVGRKASKSWRYSSYSEYTDNKL